MVDHRTKRDGRKDRTLRFRVSAEEAGEIEGRAAGAGLSLSAYVRAAALHHRTKSVYDLDAVRDLAKVNGDLGRVAGLLKWWLVDGAGQVKRPHEVDRLMSDFRVLQGKITELMQQVKK